MSHLQKSLKSKTQSEVGCSLLVCLSVCLCFQSHMSWGIYCMDNAALLPVCRQFCSSLSFQKLNYDHKLVIKFQKNKQACRYDSRSAVQQWHGKCECCVWQRHEVLHGVVTPFNTTATCHAVTTLHKKRIRPSYFQWFKFWTPRVPLAYHYHMTDMNS